jgi:two-component system, LytTR family, response regulator
MVYRDEPRTTRVHDAYLVTSLLTIRPTITVSNSISVPNPDATMDPSLLIPREAGTIRTIIADDERLAREKLKILLASEPGIQIVAECHDGDQAISAIRNLGGDLLILDVQMPTMGGFDVVNHLSQEEMPVIIFATAYDQYALRAFEANALDYLLKPFDQQRLHQAITRARKYIGTFEQEELTRRILDLLGQVKSRRVQNMYEDRLIIKEKGRIIFLNLDEIDWIDASANYVRLHVGKESHLVRETISGISQRLNPNHFVRIHRSTIVDIRKIKELIPVNSGEYIVVLRNGKELSCSRGYRGALQSVIARS